MIEILAILCVGFVAGYWWRGIMVLYKLSRDPRAAIKMLEELREIQEHEAKGTPINETRFGKGIEINVETMKGIHYLFIKETNQFVGQGPDLEKALLEANKRYPDNILWCQQLKKDSHTA